MVSPVSISLQLFFWVTGTDVLNEVYIIDGANGGACAQPDPIIIDDVSFWDVGCCLHRNESELKLL